MKKISRFFVTLITLFSLLGCLFATGVFLILFYYGRDLPDHRQLLDYQPYLTNRFYLPDGSIWRDYAKEKRFYVDFDVIPEKIVTAFLVAEDKNFFKHPGLDLMGVFKAVVKNTLMGQWKNRPKGASTITQQVAKNFMVGNERSFERKIKEAIMAVRIEHSLSKKHILELYLNQIYFGSGCYGIKVAAEHYFGKTLNDLSLDEIAFLASLPKAPENYQPEKNPSQAKIRRDWVLDRLYDEHHIDGAALIIAKSRPISTISRFKEPKIDGQYFIEAARQELIDHVGKSQYEKGGYYVWTTLDPSLQKNVNAAFFQGLCLYDKRYGYRGPLKHLESNDTVLEAFKAMDNPSKFFKIALVHEVKDEQVIITLQSGEKGVIPLKNILWARQPKEDKTLGPEIKKCQDVLTPGDIIYVSETDPGFFIPKTHEKTEILNPRFNQIFNASLTPIVGSTEGKEAEEKMMEYGESKIGKLMCLGYMLEQVPEITGGVIVMDAKAGHILALTGGLDFSSNQFNAATQAKRQPGSSLKPFIYLTALERGLTPQSTILDAPIHIPLGFTTKEGKTTYSPQNYGKKYYGPTRLDDALAYSRNTVTIRLAMMLGMVPIIKVVRDFGIYDDLPRQLAMVLGAGETTLLKLTTAYAMIANKGIPLVPTLLKKIENRLGDALERKEPTPFDCDGERFEKRQRCLEDLDAMMQGVIDKGTGMKHLKPIAQKHNVVIAGKTGTTNDYKDAWFVGYSGDIVVGIFVGYAIPKTLGDGETGGRVAAPIAAQIFDTYFSQKSSQSIGS